MYIVYLVKYSIVGKLTVVVARLAQQVSPVKLVEVKLLAITGEIIESSKRFRDTCHVLRMDLDTDGRVVSRSLL